MANSIEKFYITSIVGPIIPVSCNGASVVSSPETSVLLFGCDFFGSGDAIYQLSVASEIKVPFQPMEKLFWKRLPQKLRYPRSHTVAMFLPKELANCYSSCNLNNIDLKLFYFSTFITIYYILKS